MHRIPALLLGGPLTACGASALKVGDATSSSVSPETGSVPDTDLDADGDGFPASEDCDDTDSATVQHRF